MKVILLMAVTADGLIARNSMQFVDWTGNADKKYFVHITKKSCPRFDNEDSFFYANFSL